MGKIAIKQIALCDDDMIALDDKGRLWHLPCHYEGEPPWEQIALPDEPEAQVPVVRQMSDKVKLYFKDFWELYPKKTGKPAAEKAFKAAFDKLNDFEADQLALQIGENIRRHAKAGDWKERQFIPNPATYMNQERYNDDPVEQVAKQHRAAGGLERTGKIDF